jgi:hypothetical protein
MIKVTPPNAIEIHEPTSYTTYILLPLSIWRKAHLHPLSDLKNLPVRLMMRTPNPSNTLVQTPHGLPDPLQLLPIRIPQQRRLLHNLTGLQIPHANRLLSSVDVGTFDDWVFPRARGDGDFDLGVGGCEGGEAMFDEGAVKIDRSEEVS